MPNWCRNTITVNPPNNVDSRAVIALLMEKLIEENTAIEVYCPDIYTLCCKTSWGPAILQPILLVTSIEHPNTKIRLEYSEYMAGFDGHEVYLDGEVIDELRTESNVFESLLEEQGDKNDERDSSV